jgi:alpha-ketoglutarate-dependent taurine dioxygenase
MPEHAEHPAAGGSNPAIAISPDGRTVSLVWGKDGVTFNRFWLRDLCPSLPSKESGLRTFSVASLPADLRLAGARVDPTSQSLVVDWSDGHSSRFKLGELLDRSDEALGRRPSALPAQSFDAAHDPTAFDMSDLAPGSHCHHDLLMEVARTGFALIDNMAPEDRATETLAALLGRIRETDFGRVFNIVTEPESWTLSQSNKGQDPHSDDPFRYTPSGISILHCRQAAAGHGGSSILVDGFKIADDLRRDEPEFFELLTAVSIPYVRYRPGSVTQGEDVNMIAYAPVITINRSDQITGIRFHERSTGVFDLDPAVVDHYYLAFRAFASRVRSADNQFVRRLGDGQAIVFDNQRILHGRTGYESDSAGRRHMRLCTVDRDQVHSRLRRLKEMHGRADVRVTLHAGAMAG